MRIVDLDFGLDCLKAWGVFRPENKNFKVWYDFSLTRENPIRIEMIKTATGFDYLVIMPMYWRVLLM